MTRRLSHVDALSIIYDAIIRSDGVIKLARLRALSPGSDSDRIVQFTSVTCRLQVQLQLAVALHYIVPPQLLQKLTLFPDHDQ